MVNCILLGNETLSLAVCPTTQKYVKHCYRMNSLGPMFILSPSLAYSTKPTCYAKHIIFQRSCVFVKKDWLKQYLIEMTITV
jgi:hypothetical protein